MENDEKLSELRQRKIETTNGNIPEVTTLPPIEVEQDMRKLREQDRRDRTDFVLWRRPIWTVIYFLLEAGCLINLLGLR